MGRAHKLSFGAVTSGLAFAFTVALAPAAIAQTAQKQPDPASRSDANAARKPPLDEQGSASPSWTQSPTSVSGSDLLPPQANTSAPIPAAHDAALEARLAELEAKVRADEEKSSHEEHEGWLERHVKISGYIQPQLVVQVFNAAASPNNQPTLPAGIGSNDTTATASGTTTNKDFFRLRRARLKTELLPNEYTKIVFEFDPNLAGGANPGSGTIARNVEAVGIAKWCSCVTTEFGMGIFKVPFDFEILQTDADRPFIERSWGEQNMFPGEFDEGVHESTYAFDKKLRVDFAVVNGTMISEPNFAVVPDLNKAKDLVGRAFVDLGPVDAGVGAYYGQGAEVDAAALKFKQYPRWAGNVHAGFHHDLVKVLGATKLYGEFVLAKNMDRGLNYKPGLGPPPIPSDVVNGFLQDHDERSLFLRLEQDITRWVTLGIRYDFYSPDTAQKNDGRDTYSFVGALHFNAWLQWMIEFDHAIDNVHAPGAQAPSKQIETLSNVLQARF